MLWMIMAGEPFAESPLRRHLASSTSSSNSPEIKKSLTLVLVVSSVFLPGQARNRGERPEAPRAQAKSDESARQIGERGAHRPAARTPVSRRPGHEDLIKQSVDQRNLAILCKIILFGYNHFYLVHVASRLQPILYTSYKYFYIF